MKKHYVIWLLATLLMSPLSALADENGKSGNVSWSFKSSTGKLTLSGKGDMKDYKFYDIPVTDEFRNFIEENTGYKDAGTSSSTDIRYLCARICGVNLSVGYNYEHHVEEYLVFSEWENTLNLARKLLAGEQRKFPLKAE